ncbi:MULTISPECIES: CS1 type fimbrial major subunit [Pseudomonas]|uniref:CS1 type fimbrial major subunit n=1 Tax=Pseudomonas TaxID=286 RepID=UPI000641963C|nr:CS1 type fimbrial major subunit [Pseudomonas lundensis]MBM1187680.1 adhesin [Pseudomonas lundensis]NLU01568.1 adhesin [Pseudomonas lundensis]NNA01452.1 adhesin [Pseudomonas lundensis]NNA08432.1 adhesin [Pseudomonas lundensis]NNA32100.1 adhesin [Pseudomonas lundensis]
MLNKIVAASLFALTMGSTVAHAAGEASSLINIKATIPTKMFYVLPNDPEFGKDETLHYNPITGALSSLKQPFNVKNTDGSIHAYIEGGPASLFNGNPTQNIALATSFNGVTLTATPQEVVSDAASTPGTRADLVITPAALDEEHVGDYTASYTVIFDNVPRVVTP